MSEQYFSVRKLGLGKEVTSYAVVISTIQFDSSVV